jgi:hypothetical protein
MIELLFFHHCRFDISAGAHASWPLRRRIVHQFLGDRPLVANNSRTKSLKTLEISHLAGGIVRHEGQTSGEKVGATVGQSIALSYYSARRRDQ